MTVTITQAAEQMRQGHLTPPDVVKGCLGRIDQLEDRVRAWVLVEREQALRVAEERAEEIRQGKHRGPLHGIPIGIKDIIDVFDWPTAAGSRRWVASHARQDAPVTRRLRQAGAILLGKTVTTQYASFDPPVTRNPWMGDRTPGGSSSGSAAAVACGMCLGAIGSQTGGSITRPASFCGVAGCKPTYGRVSLAGVLPLAHSMDHVGPIGTGVRDLALILEVISGPERRDRSSARCAVPAWSALLSGRAAPPRIGRLRSMFDTMAAPQVRSMVDRAASRLEEAGARVSEVALPASFSEVLPRHRVVMAVESAAYHEERLRQHPQEYLPNITRLLEEGLRCPAAEYARCKEHQKQLSWEMASCFEQVDVLLTPATLGPAPDAATTGDPAFNSPWSYTGLPTVSFPVAWSEEGLPLAIQLIAPHWEEAGLFRAAAWCEEVLGFQQRDPAASHP